MSNTEIISIVVAVVVIAAIVAIVVFALRQKKTRDMESRRGRAQELRTEATAQSPDVQQSKLHAAEADAEAELARVRAERAEQQAAEVRQGAAVEQARQEDVVREADRVDPDVDHAADDYRPTTDPTTDPMTDRTADPMTDSSDQRTRRTEPVDPTDGGGATGPSHRA